MVVVVKRLLWYLIGSMHVEPAMDDLILGVFGDDSIFLNCNSGECLHYTMVPGFSVCSAFIHVHHHEKPNDTYLSVLSDLSTGS